MFSNIEEPYDKLPKHLHSATTKLVYCFSRGLEITFIQLFLNTLFDELETSQNEKSYIFQEIGIPEMHAQLSEHFQPNSTSRLMPCLHKKLSSGWQVELSLVKIA